MPTDIHNINELQAMNDDLTGSYHLANDIDASATSGWNGGLGFLPIGYNYSNKWTGTLDGDGHTITGLFINRPAESLIGLFGVTSGAYSMSDIGLLDVNITGYWHPGGFVGNMNDGNGTIHRCYTTGVVVGHGDVGGFVGVKNSGYIYDSYSWCSATGVGSVGGFAGAIMGGGVNRCYAIGHASAPGFVGGFLGQSGSCNYCYWDTEASGNPTSYCGTGRTTEQMYQQATFNTWNFSTIWAINEGVGYPTLQAFAGPLLKTLSDTLILTDGKASKVNKVLNDILALSDIRGLKISKAVTDTLTLSDTAAKKFFKVLADKLWLADNISLYLKIKGVLWNLRDRTLNKTDWHRSDTDEKDSTTL